VAVSPLNGDIVVTDFERHAVVVFDKFGRWLARYSGTDDGGAPAAPRSARLTDRNRLRHKRILEVSRTRPLNGVIFTDTTPVSVITQYTAHTHTHTPV